MHSQHLLRFGAIALALTSSACAYESPQRRWHQIGADPELQAPTHRLIPTIDIAPATGWRGDETPVAANGLNVALFAEGLDHPRWLYVLPNGDVLVAETNAPSRPEEETGIRSWFMRRALATAGAATPSANRITLLRDADGNGIAELRSVLIEGLNSPFGMALVGKTLYVANSDAILGFEYVEGATRIDTKGVKLSDLPAGPRNHHWTRNILANGDGTRLYATVGSNSNVGENGIEAETGRAAVLEVDIASGRTRVFASGLRNPNGLDWAPVSGRLWTTVNERDELGNDLVPDYVTSLVDGGFYGWPYSYFGQHVDSRVQPQRPDLVARAIAPDYALGSHTASLGLVFYRGSRLPQRYSGGAFIGQHGSWNRRPPSGYKVIFVPFASGLPAGPAEDVLSGFLDADGNARGRPVGVAVARDGALLVADDVGNKVWRVTASDHRL
jgi:glucose/arabinose dehydrogenase